MWRSLVGWFAVAAVPFIRSITQRRRRGSERSRATALGDVERARLPRYRTAELALQHTRLLPRDIVVAGAETLPLLLRPLLPVRVPDAAVPEDRDPLPDPFVSVAGLPARGGVHAPRRGIAFATSVTLSTLAITCILTIIIGFDRPFSGGVAVPKEPMLELLGFLSRER